MSNELTMLYAVRDDSRRLAQHSFAENFVVNRQNTAVDLISVSGFEEFNALSTFIHSLASLEYTQLELHSGLAQAVIRHKEMKTAVLLARESPVILKIASSREVAPIRCGLLSTAELGIAFNSVV